MSIRNVLLGEDKRDESLVITYPKIPLQDKMYYLLEDTILPALIQRYNLKPMGNKIKKVYKLSTGRNPEITVWSGDIWSAVIKYDKIGDDTKNDTESYRIKLSMTGSKTMWIYTLQQLFNELDNELK